MAKKPTAINVGFSVWEINDYIRECQNLVRWNARLAIDWMDAILPRLQNEVQTNNYNRAVEYINTFLDNLETYRYYDKREIWENDRVRRATPCHDFE
jgi:hypothetical protein